ncbi:MarR family transcriptional regulator [Streptomyces sp. NBC_01242]|uniref:MarR family transcriptional regulator n=1 Tax=unclassified Streptomyces TaxID=2593676 RepID=UPI0022540434|nr:MULTISPECIES: MarR family transcriptional regulator [unclassified Streptomyces]MCX4795786.1 MarR family transcriptional regulator [Streptomyces sp. NBC_01242]WSJ37070.1 MarR family transcriptional regulator [Streptomyces sp. NBC_01321]WSP56704.1 MarR family transcriptional regulator [Streptomyces sp. NBC_01241]WSU22578.1 MarR family transcriptional regulator [Streptomyces sp. NBC_01108]
MATENLSPALCTPASSRPYAKANSGYGKRSAPDQRPPRADDFMLLPERERYVAGYVDHLPDGAAMDIKSLAKNIPLYGQMAIGSALRALGVAGHLRYAQCRVEEHGQIRWVTRTFWSRTARDNEWWAIFLDTENNRATQEAAVTTATPPPPPIPTQAPAPPAGAEPQAPAPAPPAEPTTQPTTPSPTPAVPPGHMPAVPPGLTPAVPQQRTPEPAPGHPSPAYLALAQLGRIEPRLALSAADCTTLEPLATQWFTRGVDTDYLTHALTTGLPTHVDSPIGFARRRLNDKIPPHLPTTPAATTTPVRRLMLECTQCGTPGHPEALPDGLCRPCRTPTPDHTPTSPADPPAERDIHALIGNLRNLMQTP